MEGILLIIQCTIRKDVKMDLRAIINSTPRRVVLSVLHGSHNKGLAAEDSDKDYKLFVLPTFDDLYSGVYYAQPSVVTPELDYDVHDVRKLAKFLCNSNPTMLEVIFSEEIAYPCLIRPSVEIESIIALREDIARSNLPKLFDACLGSYAQRLKQLDHRTINNASIIDRYGYDLKNAVHAYRFLDIAERYHSTGFTRFESSLKYRDSDSKAIIFSIKRGMYTKRELDELLAAKIIAVKLLEPVFRAGKVDTELHLAVNDLIRNLVESNIK